VESLGQALIWFVVIAFAVAATIKLRIKMREQQMYAGDYPPFGDEVIPEDYVTPLSRMENDILREPTEKVIRLEDDYVSPDVMPDVKGDVTFEYTDYRIKKLETAKKTRAVVKKKVAPKKAKVVAAKSKRSKRK